MAKRSDIIQIARGWKGVRFRHQGRNRNGIDCAGLVVKVAEEIGMDTSMDRTDYVRRSTSVDFLKEFEKNFTWKNPKDVQPGDILVFRDNAYPYHTAIVGDSLNGLTLIHAYANRKQVVEEMYSEEWIKKRVAAFEFPEV
ncbi:MAG: C40 family peptidase [Candidatus Thorarchaeota archaeon]|jgi:cell wall-associated NlpC family hydrolase